MTNLFLAAQGVWLARGLSYSALATHVDDTDFELNRSLFRQHFSVVLGCMAQGMLP